MLMKPMINRLCSPFPQSVISIEQKLEKRSFAVRKNITSRWCHSCSRMESCHLDSWIHGYIFVQWPMESSKLNHSRSTIRLWCRTRLHIYGSSFPFFPIFSDEWRDLQIFIVEFI